MKQDEISYKVMKLEDLDRWVWYAVNCGCSNDDHSLNIQFEYDKDTPDWFWINFSKKLGWCDYWSTTGFFKRMQKRIKGSLRMLFTGYVEVEESFILDGDTHVDSFIQALQEGKQKILDYQKGQNV